MPYTPEDIFILARKRWAKRAEEMGGKNIQKVNN